MATRRDWSRYLEILFWTIAIVWLIYPLFLGNDEVPFRMKFYHGLSRFCYSVASTAGDIGLQAEQSYWDVVQELRG